MVDAEFKIGDIVKIDPNGKYYTGQPIAAWITNLCWEVSSVAGPRVMLGKSADGHYSLNIPVDAKYLSKLI